MLKSLTLSTGRRISLDFDYCADNPRDWDNLSRLLCIQNREFSLDENLTNDELLLECKKARNAGDFVFSLYVYMHSGIVFSTTPFSCAFDSGVCGAAIVPKNIAKTKERALEIVKSEIDILNSFLNGSVYTLSVEHPKGFDVICDDSIAGLYIDNENDLKDALEYIDLTTGEISEAIENIDELMPF